MTTKTMTTAATTTRTRTSSLAFRSATRPQHAEAKLWGRALVLCSLSAALPGALHAQAKPAVRHTVDGTVVNGSKQPVAGAVVYLENPKSLDVQSYLTDNQGHFHFNHVQPQTDYDVWAEQNGVETKHKFISQFSSHVNFHVVLKLTPERKKFLGIF
jgi:protocatechuate 3,4-dioxygenase beta subunit